MDLKQNNMDGKTLPADSPVSECGSSSCSLISPTISSSTTSSLPQYSEDVRRAAQTQQPPTALDLLQRQGSGSSSTKTCEVDLGDEERDTFSPGSNNGSPCDVDFNETAAAVNLNDCADNTAASGSSTKSTMLVDSKAYKKAQNDVVTPAAAAAAAKTFSSANFKVKTSHPNNTTSGGNEHLHHSTTKEEKQRQNEEIVIMETSSISSETGSWESVYPHAAMALVGAAAPFVEQEYPKYNFEGFDSNVASFKLDESNLRERSYSTGAAVAADTSTPFTCGSTSSLQREFGKCENPPSEPMVTSACFIDASSLRDEDELLSFPCLEGHQSNECLDGEAADHSEEKVEHKEDFIEQRAGTTDVAKDDWHSTNLETFHKSFAKCKLKSKEIPIERISNSNLNTESDSPEKVVLMPPYSSANNLSDEKKLWDREFNSQTRVQEKDSPTQRSSSHKDVTEASVSLVADLDSSDSSEVEKLRRVQVRKTNNGNLGSYIFQHNMQQFTVHPLGVSPKFASHCEPAAGITTHHTTVASNSDYSYTTDYSSSSPAPSLVWSEHENRSSACESSVGQLQKICLLPETHHNSIVQIDNGSSNISSMHRDYALSSSHSHQRESGFSHQRDSGAYCSDATDSPIPMPRTPKLSRFDESNPIVSGGASIKDFCVKQCESPPIKRRTDTCPIVSGGFRSLDFETAHPSADDDEEGVNLRVKPQARKPLSGIASWVVDMSDCGTERRKSTSSTSSLEISGTERSRERSNSTSSHKSGCGFYVSLSDMDKKPGSVAPSGNQSRPLMSKSCTKTNSTGYFVNLSKSDYISKPVEEATVSDQDSSKQIFSMFIDIGNGKKSNNKKESTTSQTRLAGSLPNAQRRSEDLMKPSANSKETLTSRSTNVKIDADSAESADRMNESKSLDYNKINREQPIDVAVTRRVPQQQRAQNEAITRHSWGQFNSDSDTGHNCKRSISLTVSGEESKGCYNSGLMSIIDKIPLIAKTSSLSVDSSLSPHGEYTGSKSELSTCSYNSVRNSMSGGDRDDDIVLHSAATPHSNAIRIKKRQRDVQINETFDKSSLASITDGILSKDLSPASTTDTDDLTFQQDEELAIREAQQQHETTLPPLPQLLSTSNRSSAIIMETIIEAKETFSPKTSASGHTLESLHATIEKQKMLLETVNEQGENKKDTFVKLSDMDKPIKLGPQSPHSMMSKSVSNHRQINRIFGDESSPKGRPHSWTMTRSTGNSFLNITNSVDNLRSLSRLFPHFSKEFSSSLPNDMTLDHMDYIQTDISADSSLASSFSRSAMDESSISCRQPRRLGEDLLKMFLQEIATDMIVEVHGRRIKAHKCILRSRCQYFAAMLAGNGAQSVVSLQGYSFSAVHFALCHIYSGASHPPDGISLMELAALADLLGLESLKEVTAHALKTNYCHNFHKPCSGCIDGILQVLPVALNHALDDLYRKCLRWACRHYLKVWPTRQFAQLPPDILGRCRQQIVAYMSPETVLVTILDCENLLNQLAAYRWGGICENLVRDILDAAYVYIAEHFASLIASDAFLSLGHDRSCYIPQLEGVLLRTASSLMPDQACRSYQRVTRLNTVLQAKVLQMPANLGELAKELQGLQEEDLDWDAEYVRFVSAILLAVEQCLIRQCSRAMRVTAWQRMDLDLRKRIQTLARLTEPIDMKRNKPVSKAFSFGGSTRSQDLYQVKLALQAHTKRSLGQDTQLFKATQTHDEGIIQTTERGVQANNDLREVSGTILKSNSRAYVPKAAYKPHTVNATERNSLNTKKCEQPDRSNKQKSKGEPKLNANVAATKQQQQQQQQSSKAPLRLVDVRPRYLEPRKARPAANVSDPVRSVTSSSTPTSGVNGANTKQRKISSSDCSRNSSPAAVRKGNAQSAAKIGTKSINISLDSLVSPSRRKCNAATNDGRRATRGSSSGHKRYSDDGIDSIESIKSSGLTNKIISQESLTGATRLSQSNGGITANFGQTVKIHKAKPITKPGATVVQSKHLVYSHHNASTASSPSSVTTTKSMASRISSVSSTQSTRDIYKQRSISVPASQQHLALNNTAAGQPSQRRSFLSAKSREILAKRAEKNKQLQLELEKQQQNNSSTGEKHRNYNDTAPLRSSTLVSSIPTRRPNTLHLKKNNGACNNKSSALTYHSNNSKLKKSNTLNITNSTDSVQSSDKGAQQSFELIINDIAAHELDSKKQNLSNLSTELNSQSPSLRIEPKLERSSTFCKENSDLDLSELQIIE